MRKRHHEVFNSPRPRSIALNMASQERTTVLALLALLLSLLVVLARVVKHKPNKPKMEKMQAESYASSVLKENKEVFEKLAEM
jgi:hypothetical protein